MVHIKIFPRKRRNPKKRKKKERKKRKNSKTKVCHQIKDDIHK